MQCSEFEDRLQYLLDLRSVPHQDAALQSHAQICPRCRDQLLATGRLLDGLELLEAPELDDDFAQKVVLHVGVPARHPVSHSIVVAALALAATALIAISPSLWSIFQDRQPVATNPRPTHSGSANRNSAESPTLAASNHVSANQGWMVSQDSIQILYPEETRQRHRQQMSQIADDLRPIASPFNAAVTALRRSLPVVRSRGKTGEPRASIEMISHLFSFS